MKILCKTGGAVDYIRDESSHSSTPKRRGGRHVAVENLLTNKFVPNLLTPLLYSIFTQRPHLKGVTVA